MKPDLWIGLMVLGALIVACDKKEEKSDNVNKVAGYDELTNKDSIDTFGVSEYNTDLDSTNNIKRPNKSQIVNSKFDTTMLFRIWVQNPDDPHATFDFNSKFFFVVDYDGDGDMPYILEKDNLKVFYNDFVQEGKIEKVTNDSLIIQWTSSDIPAKYTIWKN